MSANNQNFRGKTQNNRNGQNNRSNYNNGQFYNGKKQNKKVHNGNGQGYKGNNQKQEEVVEEFDSKNMNYIYNVEYFDKVYSGKNSEQSDEEKAKAKVKAEKANAKLCGFVYPEVNMFEEFNGVEGYKSFVLYTTYPGLLMGTGNLHDIRQEGAFKQGFSFDYVNGLPYLPGASLKGVLRSIFPGQHEEDKDEYKSYLMGVMKEIGIEHVQCKQLEELEEEIFDFKDVFLGAYPSSANQNTKYLETDYITPHKPLKNPNPISFLKVKGGVGMQFNFILRDGVILSADEKLLLFKKLIQELGVGAKTNIGYGKFSEKR